MRRLLCAVLASTLTSTGCVNYIDTVHVRVRDPALVAVLADSPIGVQPLLAAGSDEATAGVPASSPPYVIDARPGASVTRYGTHALFAWCTWCEPASSRPLVTPGGDITLSGTPDHTLARPGDDLRMRFDYKAPLPCRHGKCQRPAFALLLETPRANVVDLHFERRVSTDYGELTGAKISIATGVVFGVAGVATLGYDGIGDRVHGSAWDALFGASILFMAYGAFFFTTGYATLTARDSDTRIAP